MAGGIENHDDSMEESDGFMESTEHSECDLSDVGDMEFYDDANEYCSVHQHLKDDIRKALAAYPQPEDELGIPSVQIDETRTGLKYISSVVLTFTLKEISDHLLELWDLEDTPAIIMEMDNIHRGEFRSYGQLPTITVKKHSSEGHFIVGEQLKNFALRLCRESFSLRTNESPEVAGSFFRLVYGKVKERLLRLSEYCITCGEILSTGGVLPSICDRDLCMYQYSELHLFDGLSVPRVSPEVLSLLIFAFSNANLSSRRSDILTPAPPIRSIKDLLEEAKEKRLAKRGEIGDAKDATSEQMTGSTYWNYTVTNAQIQNSKYAYSSIETSTFSVLLENMPCPKEFLASVSSYAQFRKEWTQMSDIIDWLVISNRSYLEFVPRPMNVDFLHTDNQYCFVSDTPAKQAQFDKLVADNGGKTRFFYHGSPLDNWHSIIRSGLKNMSGTKYQLVGAAYGKGIYLSPFLDFALGYASRGITGSSFTSRRLKDGSIMTQDRPIRSDCKNSCCATERTEDLSCVALVEVVDCPAAYSEKTDEIFVVEKEQWCSIRMLLLYRQSDINKLHEAVSKACTKDYVPGSRTMASMGRGPKTNRKSKSTSAATAAAQAAASGAAPATGVAGGGAPPPAVVPPLPSSASMGSTGGGLMSYMMSKFSTWAAASGAPTGTGNPTASQTTTTIPSATASDLETKREERKKRREAREAKYAALMASAEGGSSADAAPPPPSNSPVDPTPAAPAAASDTAAAADDPAALVDLTKEEEEFAPTDDVADVASRQDPGPSGLNKRDGDSDDELLVMPRGDGDKKKTAKGDYAMYKKMRDKQLADQKEKKDMIERKKGKNLFKRKRSLSDSMAEVPKKTSSSPSMDRGDDTNLTDEDLKMVEMFAESDLGESGDDDFKFDDEDIQVTKVVPRKEKKKGKQEKEETKAMEDDDTDDEIEIIAMKEGNKKMKHIRALKAIRERQQAIMNDIMSKESVTNEEKNEGKDMEDGDRVHVGEKDSPAGPSTSQTSSFIRASASLFPRSRSFRLLPSTLSSSKASGLPPQPLLLPNNAPRRPVTSRTMTTQTAAQLQQQQQYLAASQMLHQQLQQQQQSSLQQTHAQTMALLQQQQMTFMQQFGPPPLPTTTATGNTSASSLSINVSAPPPPLPGSVIMSGMMPPGFPGSSVFQMMGSMLSRRRRRGGDGGGIPGDLTSLTDEQREQIARVVRMFRNSGFEERVNRHMNREEKKEEDEEEEAEGDKIDEEEEEDDGPPM
ncbi:hypothetical protein PRIPAC_72439 [Pristionchus pacificus]|nr:hypothetical protein PRIPAC_72439 [Pristionchus pacificus]